MEFSPALASSAFAVHGRPDLSLVIYTSASDAAEARVKSLISSYADGVGI
ncbi:hypothetical protein [Paraburkholderia azotifigens]|uniref:Uncharacterized protein n=1 Tax=Paraburkholderia azotifigens TaxID=2057004 RepID=A0ABU9R8M1_9BURK|nr:hypothetical protein [Paraburkholderia azotifigens]